MRMNEHLKMKASTDAGQETPELENSARYYNESINEVQCMMIMLDLEM